MAGEATMAALEKEREQREGAGAGAQRGTQRRAKWGSPASGGAGAEARGRLWLRDGHVPSSAERDGNTAGVGDAHKLMRSVTDVAYAGKQLEMEEKLFTVLFMEAQQVNVKRLLCHVLE